MIKELKNTYEKILELNLQINSMLNNFPKDDFDSFNENLQGFLDEKDKFIQKLLSFKENSEQELKKLLAKPDLKEISGQINKLEEENLILIQEKKVCLSKEINQTNKATKALSAYKFNKQDKPRIFDETD
jgi:hypothetical protein